MEIYHIVVTDTPFLTKMQKRTNPQIGNCPPATINLQKMTVPARLKLTLLVIFIGGCFIGSEAYVRLARIFVPLLIFFSPVYAASSVFDSPPFRATV